MATVQEFEDLKVWQEARSLALAVYQATAHPAFTENHALKYQIRKSSGSVMDNIAEGFERGGKGEFIQFLSIAKGSAGEVRSQLHRAFDQSLLSEDRFAEMTAVSRRVSQMISSLMKYLKESELKGNKYRKSGPATAETKDSTQQ